MGLICANLLIFWTKETIFCVYIEMILLGQCVKDWSEAIFYSNLSI